MVKIETRNIFDNEKFISFLSRYNIKVEIKRGILQRDIMKVQEVYLENRPQ